MSRPIVLSGLVEDMLKLSQIDSGHLPEQRSQVDLARLVREEAARQQPFAEKRSQHLQRHRGAPRDSPGQRGAVATGSAQLAR